MNAYLVMYDNGGIYENHQVSIEDTCYTSEDAAIDYIKSKGFTDNNRNPKEYQPSGELIFKDLYNEAIGWGDTRSEAEEYAQDNYENGSFSRDDFMYVKELKLEGEVKC